MLACLIPILGRRTVVNKLTFGIGGKLGSSAWPLMGVLSACLNLCANFFNAGLIRSTPGYHDVPVASLALLWCTRPRLAWLAVFLARFEAEEGIYFNAAASAITSEAILQVIGAVYFGITANYGRMKRFYYAGHLAPYPRGADAHIMYAGALLWLIMCLYTLGTCLVCMVGLGEVIENAGRVVAGIRNVASVQGPLQGNKWVPQWLQTRLIKNQQLETRKLAAEEIKQIRNIVAARIIFITFLAQWLFWAGFVSAAKERYRFLFFWYSKG